MPVNFFDNFLTIVAQVSHFFCDYHKWVLYFIAPKRDANISKHFFIEIIRFCDLKLGRSSDV